MKPESKTIVIDANILIRAILGRRTFSIIKENIGSVFFCTPQVCYDEVSFNLPKIAQKRNLSETEAQLNLEILNDLRKLVIPIEEDIYINNRKNALNRIGERDRKDWSILALALTLTMPGCGNDSQQEAGSEQSSTSTKTNALGDKDVTEIAAGSVKKICANWNKGQRIRYQPRYG